MRTPVCVPAFPREAIEGALVDRFEKIARQYSDRPALTDRDRRWTYGELNRAANRIAHAIVSRRGIADEPVPLLLPQSADSIVAVIGVLKARKAYCALDPSHPESRLSHILQELGASLVITNKANAGLARKLSSGCSEFIVLEELEGQQDEDLDIAFSPSLAAIIYTSGSTGRPKGVQHTERTIQHRVWLETDAHHICANDRISMLFSLSFSASIADTFGSLLNGACLCLYDIRSQGLDALTEWLWREQITFFHIPVAAARQFVDLLDPKTQFPAVRHFVPSGVIFRSDLGRFWNHFPNCVLTSHIGSSETSMIARMKVTPATTFQGDVVPLGYPVADKEILILDDAGKPVPAGETGEIAIRSRYLSTGYVQRPDLTSRAFISEPDGGDIRLYRMGDLGRFSSEGYLEHLGRRDAQVKVRGYTVHISEVEAALYRQGSIREAAVVATDSQPGDKRLVAYIVLRPGARATIQAIRNSLRGMLPEYMVPSSFMVVEELPRTANGKLDTGKLPVAGRERPALGNPFLAPRNEIETELAHLWGTVLDLESVGIEDEFLELGGHSLAATRITSRILHRYGINLPPTTLFQSCTIASLAATIETELRAVHRSIPRQNAAGSSVLSFAQLRLWFLAQLEHSPIYNVPRAVRISGPLNTSALRRALNAVVGRHQILHSTFAMSGDEPVQTAGNGWTVELPVVDLRYVPAADRDSRIRDLVKEETLRTFDLSTDLMIRPLLVWVDQEQYVLLFTTHHIASDAFSREILLREIAAFYEEFTGGKPANLPDLPIQYADYAVWQRQQIGGEVLSKQVSYWKKQLAGLAPVTELPFDRPRNSKQAHTGATHSFRLPRSLSESLKALSRDQSVTPFMTILAAFQTLLHRYTGSDDIAVGSPVTGRNRVETESLIGFFANMLVFRTDFAGNPDFMELLQRVRRMALEAYGHQDLPFEKLVEELRPERDLTRNPLFQVAFVMQSSTRQELKLAGTEVAPLNVETGTSKFDLTLAIRETTNPEQEIEGFFEYDTELFNADTIARMSGHFETLLQAIVADPTRRISTLPLLTGAERRQIIEEWNHTRADYAVATCIHRLFEMQVQRTPASIAVTAGEQHLTYTELNRKSNQLAHYLRKLGIGPNRIVAVYLEPSAEMLVAFLAVLKTGAAYLPLDVSSPAERIQLMLNDAQTVAVLTSRSSSVNLPDGACREICLDDDWSAIALERQENPVVSPDKEDIAYVLYTSGSSGTPKGVLVPHRALSNHMQWMASEFPLTADDRVLQRTRCSFDASVWEFYAPLIAGARLIIAPSAASSDPSALVGLIDSQHVSVLQVVPSVLRLLLNERGFANCRSLRQVFCGGEALPVELRDRFLEALPCKLTNLYGPTETCIDSTFYNCEKGVRPGGSADIVHGVVPIGRPITNTSVYVLDGAGQPVPLGIAGELYIGGEGVAKGYLNRPELTAQRFLRNPFSIDAGSRVYRTGDIVRYDAGGILHFVRRADDQVKLRGFRIELQEIEAVLRGHGSVAEAVVTVREERPGDQRLVAYIVQRRNEPCSVRELRRFLEYRLPDYMIPGAYVFLDVLPLMPNGKVDRKSLPAPVAVAAAADGAHVPPCTPIEHVLVWIWSEVLGVKDIGVSDNFFELGGHSLLATQVTSRIGNILKINLPVRSIFEAPTVKGLSQIVQAKEGSTPYLEAVARLVTQIAETAGQEATSKIEVNDALKQTF